VLVLHFPFYCICEFSFGLTGLQWLWALCVHKAKFSDGSFYVAVSLRNAAWREGGKAFVIFVVATTRYHKYKISINKTTRHSCVALLCCCGCVAVSNLHSTYIHQNITRALAIVAFSLSLSLCPTQCKGKTETARMFVETMKAILSN